MDVLRRMRRQDRCPHRVTVTVRNAGIERVVCEACGHVSVHFLSDLSGEVDRDRFARPVEREGRHARAEDEVLDDEPLVDVMADASSQSRWARNKRAPLWGRPDEENA